jgi:carbamoylphosphate synthase large subunit
LDIVGACNIQFALNPLCIEYYIIKVNPGLSHSSAFVSIATGYPLAYITTKLKLGLNLVTLTNNLTNTTGACLEPNVDYLAIKISRHDYLTKSNRL